MTATTQVEESGTRDDERKHEGSYVNESKASGIDLPRLIWLRDPVTGPNMPCQ